MSKTKVTVGTTYPHFWGDRLVNAEVVSIQKIGRRYWCRLEFTESQQPVLHGDDAGSLSGKAAGFDSPRPCVARSIESIVSMPTFAPARPGSCVVQWIDFGHAGLWCEIRDDFVCGSSRPTHWQRCEYGTVDALLASGDAVRVN